MQVYSTLDRARRTYFGILLPVLDRLKECEDIQDLHIRYLSTGWNSVLYVSNHDTCMKLSLPHVN